MFAADNLMPSIISRHYRIVCFFVGVCLAGAAMTVARAAAEGAVDGTAKAASIAFDIAPQSLETALDAFSSTSNVQVLYETALTSGRGSAKVKGLLTPEAALDALLAGTGLTAWRTTADSYSLVRQSNTSLSSDNIGHPPPEIARYGRFLGMVQEVLVGALCRNPATRPGQYKIALKFAIGPSGRVLSTSLLNSTGDQHRDGQVLAAVRHLAVGEAPPRELPQPITMVIAPRSPDMTGDCVSADEMRASR